MGETAYQRMKREAEEAPSATTERVRRVYRRDPEVAKARAAEKTRRYQEAARRATIVLKARHADEWADVLQAERDGVDAERGPLPGDTP